MEKPQTTQLLATITRDQHKKVKNIAITRGLSVSHLIRILIDKLR
jgi:hypothetical protein